MTAALKQLSVNQGDLERIREDFLKQEGKKRSVPLQADRYGFMVPDELLSEAYLENILDLDAAAGFLNQM